MTPQEKRLMDNLRLRLPGAVDGVLQLELFNTLQTFFDNSSCWIEDVPLTTIIGETDYPLATTQGDINRLEALVLDDGSNASIAGTMPVPGLLRLILAPQSVYPLKATVVLNVSLDDVSSEGMPDVPDWLYGKYYDAVINGVLSQMMSQPAKPYSNVNMAVMHRKIFQAETNQARVERLHGNLQYGQRWSFPAAGIPRRQRR